MEEKISETFIDISSYIRSILFNRKDSIVIATGIIYISESLFYLIILVVID
jgi:hypothetical protein